MGRAAYIPLFCRPQGTDDCIDECRLTLYLSKLLVVSVQLASEPMRLVDRQSFIVSSTDPEQKAGIHGDGAK